MGGELVTPASRPSFSQIFHQHFPFYISIGMPPELYWEGDCTLTRDYRAAFQYRQRLRNQELWLQGVYFRDALANVFPLFNPWVKNTKPPDYPAEPYPLTEEERRVSEERRVRKAVEQFKVYAETINQRFKREEVEQDGYGASD